MKKIFLTLLILTFFTYPAFALDINDPNDRQVLIMFDRPYSTQDLLKNNIASAKLIEDVTDNGEIIAPAGTEVFVKVTDIKKPDLCLKTGSLVLESLTFKDIYGETYNASINETLTGSNIGSFTKTSAFIGSFGLVSLAKGPEARIIYGQQATGILKSFGRDK